MHELQRINYHKILQKKYLINKENCQANIYNKICFNYEIFQLRIRIMS